MYRDKLQDLGIKLTRTSGSEKCFCPACHDGRKNKRDRSLSVNITTGEYNCHNPGCNFRGNVRAHERKRDTKKYEKPSQEMLRSIELKERVIGWFKSRGISENTLNKHFIHSREEWMPQTSKKESCICFPYLRNGEIVNYKLRDGAKNFRMHKEAELILYNLQAIGDKKFVIFHEGEIDALSSYEAGFGADQEVGEGGELLNDEYSKWACVSVPNGAATGEQKMDYLDNCSEYLEAVETFVIAVDDDSAGKNLQQELIRRLGIERCKTISYPIEEVVPTKDGLKRRCKDINEVLMYFGSDVVKNVINNAQSIPIDGVFYVEDIFPAMLENFRRGIQLAPSTHFGDLDTYFRWKKGDINLFVGMANHGKTTFVLQLMLTKSIEEGWKWGIFSPENFPATDFYDDLVEMYIGKWLDRMTEEEYVAGADFLDKHFFYVYPDGSHDLNTINEKFRYLVMKKGIDGVLIDPFNQLDHLQKPYQREDQYLSECLKDIKRFALLNCVSYNIIAHPVKQQRDQDKSYPPVDMYDIAGGAMWANKSDNIVSYYRPNHHVDKTSPEVRVYVQKIKRRRTGGQPGEFDMRLNWGIKRFVDNENGEAFCNPQKEKTAPRQQSWMPFKEDEFNIDF